MRVEICLVGSSLPCDDDCGQLGYSSRRLEASKNATVLLKDVIRQSTTNEGRFAMRYDGRVSVLQMTHNLGLIYWRLSTRHSLLIKRSL